MKQRNTSIGRLPIAAVLAAFWLASGASDGFGEEGGRGGVPSPNLASDAKDLPADPGKAAVLWEIKLGTHQYSIPTLDRGRIYIGANDAGIERPGYKPTRGGAVRCVEQATGKLIWQLASPRYFEGVKAPLHFDQWGCGICSGPVVEGNRVYVVGNRGEVLCLDRDGQANGNDGPFTDELAYMGITNSPGNELGPTDGDIVWKYNLLTELGVAPHDVCGSTLLLQGDFIYACTSNGLDDRHAQPPQPLAPSLIALDKTTGRLVASDAENIGQRLLHCLWSSPSAGQVKGRTLIFFGGGDGILYAFQPPEASRGSAVQTLKKAWLTTAIHRSIETAMASRSDIPLTTRIRRRAPAKSSARRSITKAGFMWPSARVPCMGTGGVTCRVWMPPPVPRCGLLS